MSTSSSSVDRVVQPNGSPPPPGNRGLRVIRGGRSRLRVRTDLQVERRATEAPVPPAASAEAEHAPAAGLASPIRDEAPREKPRVDEEMPERVPTSPGASADLVGREIGRFRVTGLERRGAAGSVYEAQHTGLDLKARVYELDTGYARELGSSTLSTLQLILARASGVRHAGLLRIFDAELGREQLRAVVEWPDATPLAARIETGERAGEGEALRLLQSVAEALEAALGAGLIHGDLSPERIIVSEAGKTKIDGLGLPEWLDWGVAREREGVSTEHLYRAPERISGDRPIDHRSDIFAVGAILHHLLAGEPPFAGADEESVRQRQNRGAAASVQERNPDVSKATADLIAYMLALRPEERPQTYGALLALVEGSILRIRSEQARSRAKRLLEDLYGSDDGSSARA